VRHVAVKVRLGRTEMLRWRLSARSLDRPRGRHPGPAQARHRAQGERRREAVLQHQGTDLRRGRADFASVGTHHAASRRCDPDRHARRRGGRPRRVPESGRRSPHHHRRHRRTREYILLKPQTTTRVNLLTNTLIGTALAGAPGFCMDRTASAADEKTKVTLGTATPGGGFPLYGGVVAEVVNATDPSLLIEPRNTKGSTENVPLLEQGKLDIGLVQGEGAYEALAGIGRPPADLRIIAAMYSTPGMFVVGRDSAARSIDDLKGKPVAFGARGSGLVVLVRYVLDGIGLDPDKDFQAIYLDRAGD